MAKMSFEASMADLEQMQGPPAVVLEEAAKILRVDLDGTIRRSATELLYKTRTRSQGFKEQWVLRWLLKKSGISDSKMKSAPADSQRSFILCPEFWSLLLNLKCSISDDVFAEILLERHFYQSLADFIQQILQNHKNDPTTVDGSSIKVEHEGPPAKKRRLSPPSSRQQAGNSEALVWTALQATCGCIDLFNTSSTQAVSPHDNPPAWTGSLQKQAALLGNFLRLITTILKHDYDTTHEDQAAGMLNTLLSFWETIGLSSSARDDERQQAFAFHCLAPCLSLLDLFMSASSVKKSLASARNELNRLLALHVVFPLRKTFNEQFNKKWRATTDALLYEHIDTLLQAYNRNFHLFDGNPSDGAVDSSKQQLSWIVLEIAARSIPFSDLRRRQQEQQYLDSLFIWLVHVTWPHVPRITSTGVLTQQLIDEEDAWVYPLERLFEVAYSRKLRISLPVVSYTLQAILATDVKLAPWSLLIKVIQLDPDILVPVSASSASKNFLGQVTTRIESTTVSGNEYDLVRDQLVLPLMRNCARSRALGLFVEIWQQWLAEAIRVRYVSKHGQDGIPTLLVWDDDDIFDEFEVLSALHAPPAMAGQILSRLVPCVEGLGEKLGSTASEFAKIAIFSTLLENTFSESGKLKFSPEQLSPLFRGAMDALRRISDYQGQRWRLRRLIRQLVQVMEFETLPADVDSLLTADCGFVSLEAASKLDPDNTPLQAGKFLECLECFSLVVKLAAKSAQFQSEMKAEIQHLCEAVAAFTDYERTLWHGRSVDCNGVDELVVACIGKLLESSAVFSVYPSLFTQFIGQCLNDITGATPRTLAETSSPNRFNLSMAILQDEEVICAPHLRQMITKGIATACSSDRSDLEACGSVLRRLAVEIIDKPAAEKLSDGMRKRLFNTAYSNTMEMIAKDLTFLLHLETLYPGIAINPKHINDWGTFSNARLELKDASCSQALAVNRPGLPSSYLLAIGMLKQVFQAIWARAVTTSDKRALPNLILWVETNFDHREKCLQKGLPWSIVQLILLCAHKPVSSNEDIRQDRPFQEMLDTYLGRSIHQVEELSQTGLGPNNITLIKLALDGICDLQDTASSDRIRRAAAAVQESLRDYTQPKTDVLKQQDESIILSINRKCFELDLRPEPRSVQVNVGRWLLGLLLDGQPAESWTNATIMSLAAKADLFTRQLGSEEWSSLLQTIRQQGQRDEYQPTCAVIVASVIAHVEQQHIARYPHLAQEIAEIMSLANAADQYNETGLLLGLDNSKQVLEFHPLVVNQSTLDRLLASLQAIASGTSSPLQDLTKSAASFASAPIFEKICDVVGAILGRHRRRLPDRYHLLVPVLQALLRCLFWPGYKAIESQRGAAASVVTMFGKTLPRWMRVSAEPLPLASADQLSRLLSSICNPTVSAARSSNKRRNELNDEVKKAQKLAGEHMQYLVTEYCRCVLDGQIAPLMKNQLMPGLYQVINAIDRDLMRAMNAGMDPSSRAIFKSLYEDWTKYGRWDKS